MVVKPSGRSIKTAKAATPSERVVGASMTTEAYVYQQDNGFIYSGVGTFLEASWISQAKRRMAMTCQS